MSSNGDKNPDIDELLKRACTHAMINELSVEIDPQEGLRKALLTLILITEYEADSPVADFITHLLFFFPPLAQHFIDHKHELFDGESVMRAGTAEGDKVILLARKSLWTRALKTLDDE